MEAFLSAEMLLRALMRFFGTTCDFSEPLDRTHIILWVWIQPYQLKAAITIPCISEKHQNKKRTLSWISNASLELGNSEDRGPVSDSSVFVHI